MTYDENEIRKAISVTPWHGKGQYYRAPTQDEFYRAGAGEPETEWIPRQSIAVAPSTCWSTSPSKRTIPGRMPVTSRCLMEPSAFTVSITPVLIRHGRYYEIGPTGNGRPIRLPNSRNLALDESMVGWLYADRLPGGPRLRGIFDVSGQEQRRRQMHYGCQRCAPDCGDFFVIREWDEPN